MLGRNEEAIIRAYARADEQADVTTLFGILNITNRSDELIAYLEQRWADIEALHRDFPPYGAYGDFLMLQVALAYSRAGQQTQFEKAMSLYLENQEFLEAAGVKNKAFYMSAAVYYSMAGDLESSLDYLERAASLGETGPSRIVMAWPALEPLEGDPRFEAIQARMTEHLNSERAKLGLEPATI